MNKEYIDFGIAPYALSDILLAMRSCNIHDYFITKEDNDLHIRVSVEDVYKSVGIRYGKKEDIEECALPKELK